MTVSVAAGQEECFYESVQAGHTLSVEYQVGRYSRGAFTSLYKLATLSALNIGMYSRSASTRLYKLAKLSALNIR